MFFDSNVSCSFQVENTPNLEGGISGPQNTEFYLLPICQESCDSSESETSKKTEDEESSKSKNSDSESPKTKKSEGESPKTKKGDGESSKTKKSDGESPKTKKGDGESSKKPKTSKRKMGSTPFGETSKKDSDSFYVDIIYAVLHMIGESCSQLVEFLHLSINY